MSAFIVSHDHIDVLLTFAVNHQVSYFIPATPPATDSAWVTINAGNASEVGTLLLDENERSVRTRYPNDEPGELPGSDADTVSYRFKPFDAPALHVLKACDCFDYQACETDDYEATLAHRIINAIRASATSGLPGYLDAPWESHRPVKVGAP
jgi:hypothetical protein